MSLGISSTSSAINEANLRRRQLRNLGVFTQDDEKAFGPELSAIAANERGDLARFGAAYAQAKADAAKGQLETSRAIIADKRQKELVEAQKTKDIASGVAGAGTMAYGGYKMGKEMGLWGKEATSAITGEPYFGVPAASQPAFEMPAVQLPSALMGETATPALTEAMTAAGGGAITTGTEGVGVLAPELIGEMGVGAIESLAGTSTIAGEALSAAALAGEGAAAAEAAVGAGMMAEAGAAAGSAATVPGIGWVVGAGILAVAGLITAFGGGKKSVVCTEMVKQGLIDEYIWHFDSLYASTLPYEVYNGYLMLFTPVVNKMKHSKRFSRFVAFFGKPAAMEMAHRYEPRIKGNLFGKIILSIGIPICSAYYHLKRSASWQIG